MYRLKPWFAFGALAVLLATATSGYAQNFNYDGSFNGSGTTSGTFVGVTGVAANYTTGSVYVVDNGTSVYQFQYGGAYQNTFPSTLITNPQGVATTADGSKVYVANTSGSSGLSVFNSNGSGGTYITGSYTTGTLAVQQAGTNAGYVYSLDAGVGSNNQVKVFNTSNVQQSDITLGSGFNNLRSLAVDSNGNLLAFGDNSSFAHVLDKFNSSGTLLDSLTFSGVGIKVATDAYGNVFVTGDGTHAFVEYNSTLSSIIDSEALPTGLNGGSLTSISIDGNGNVFLGATGVGGSGGAVYEYSPQTVPEASSFVLGGLLASVGLGAYAWRRARQAKVAITAAPAIA
jgi:DNA-binding beta-propeller fold protein YncE